MSIKSYYETAKAGVRINGKVVAPRIGQSGETLMWIVDEADGAAVINHMAAAGIKTIRTMVKDGKMAIEARA